MRYLTDPTRLRFGLLGLMIGLCVLAGCSSLGRQRQRESVVQARQTALRGLDAAQAEQWDVAERLYQQAVEICPVDERARRGYADALWHRGDKGKAIEQMQEAVRLGGDEATMLVRLGEMYLANGDLKHAGEMAEKAVDAGRKLAQAYRLKGDVLRAMGEWQQALASYHRSLSLQSDYPEVQLAVAQIYFEQRRPQRALSTLQLWAEKYPQGDRPLELVFWQGLALKSLHRYEQAANCLAEADRRGMRSPDLLYQLADANYRAGNLAQAQIAIRRAQDLDPNHPAAANLAGSIEQSRLRMASLPR